MCALDRVKASVEAELKVWDQPSIAVGVIKDGKVELCEGFGYADVESGRKAALAVRARNVDALQLLFGVSQMVAQVLHPGQTGCALPHARQGVQGFNCLLGRHSSSSS